MKHTWIWNLLNRGWPVGPTGSWQLVQSPKANKQTLCITSWANAIKQEPTAKPAKMVYMKVDCVQFQELQKIWLINHIGFDGWIVNRWPNDVGFCISTLVYANSILWNIPVDYLIPRTLNAECVVVQSGIYSIVRLCHSLYHWHSEFT